MSKTSKEIVMEALINSASADLSTDQIVWASSHLPDNDNETGDNIKVTRVDHSKRSILEALGYDEIDADKAAHELKDIIVESDKKSEMVEKIKKSILLTDLMVIKGIEKTMEEIQVLGIGLGDELESLKRKIDSASTVEDFKTALEKLSALLKKRKGL
jgi:cell fate (sporulation/competence/biofilm development) regulator YlbF (YheA/YmcA/DUF963 family)